MKKTTDPGGETMRKVLLSAVPCFLLAVALICCLVIGPSAVKGESVYYGENEWNYVEIAMDTSHGIPEDASGVLARIERNGVLRVAVDPSLVPRVFQDQSAGEIRYAGADMELARLIAERMGVELKIVALDESQILPSLTEDQCDLTISALTFTPARALSYALSKGYDFSDKPPQIGLILREESRTEINSLNDLNGRILAAQISSLAETVGVQLVQNYQEYRRVSSVQGVFQLVAEGKADAGFVMIRTAENWLQSNPDSGLCLADGLVFQPDSPYLGYRVAAKKGEARLIAFVNGIIDEVLSDGRYEKWLEEAREKAKELGL